jgi:hypothetical protein
VKQVPGKRKAERRLFLEQLLLQVPRLGADHRVRVARRAVLGSAEQARLRRHPLRSLSRLQRTPGRSEHRRPVRFDAIESTRARERLDHAAVHAALVDAPAQVVQAGERPAFARPENRADRGLAGTAHRAEPVSNRVPVDRDEAISRRIHIRRQQPQSVRDSVFG